MVVNNSFRRCNDDALPKAFVVTYDLCAARNTAHKLRWASYKVKRQVKWKSNVVQTAVISI